MKDPHGTSRPPSTHKSLSDMVKYILCCQLMAPNKYKQLDALLEMKIMEIKRRGPSGNVSFKTIDAIIMKFPQFQEGFKAIRYVFELYDEDSNGAIDIHELRKCLHALEFSIKDSEINDLFHYCDMDENKGIRFEEFIVLLCLAYLLFDSSTSPHANPNWPLIKTTFNAIVEVFLFLDKRGDGKLKRKDVARALNEASPKERSPSHITRTRFRELDWDRNGKVSFKEFIYSFVDWVGTDNGDDETQKL